MGIAVSSTDQEATAAWASYMAEARLSIDGALAELRSDPEKAGLPEEERAEMICAAVRAGDKRLRDAWANADAIGEIP